MGLMGIWTEPELMCGFVAASAPVIPRLFNVMRKKSPFLQIGAAFQKLFGMKKASEEEELLRSQAQVVNQEPKPKVISDIDFHELIVKTDRTETTIGSEESEMLKKPDYVHNRPRH
ncbi:hypothetical protein K469DRAFT_694127 [Zopfia rhizophila CBS 207.26]|uniref:Uncharacterized protein n=1 Tax=Zopfia rhizophila CBS 207.26 TaxID=1314779 RepID=A0A6A6DIW0_9PEZI|nr:hypothetical protein K469DRAFT_694127 [Zopfia rhizophila CBS 207.26]